MDYVSGSNVNPNLTLTRGMTYRLNVTVNGYPFRIASSSGEPAFNVDVTNNDVMMGTLTFKVPMDAPSQLHYYCLAHPGMNGIINIQQEEAPSTAPPCPTARSTRTGSKIERMVGK